MNNYKYVYLYVVTIWHRESCWNVAGIFKYIVLYESAYVLIPFSLKIDPNIQLTISRYLLDNTLAR